VSHKIVLLELSFSSFLFPPPPPPPSSTFHVRPYCFFAFRINKGTLDLIQTICRTPWTWTNPISMPLPTQENTNREDTGTDIRASSGIRTNNPSILAGEDILCLKLCGHF
jgi:hypothetical protein